MEKLRPTQILLTPEQHQELVKIARDEGRSVSALIREIVRQSLEQHAARSTPRERRIEALESIREFREEILREHDGERIDFDVVGSINQARDEQDARNWSILTGTDEDSST